MKSLIALPLLVAAALAAPQLEARDAANATTGPKPVKEADTKRADCWQKDPDVSWMLPATATRNEDCTGTIEYCLRGFYSRHGEEFSDADACLRSRGLDPATAVDAMRIVSRDDYNKGFLALDEANEIYNRYMLINRLMETHVSADTDKEGNDMIYQLWQPHRRREAKESNAISTAKFHFKHAFGSKHDAEVEAGIEEAKDKLHAAWTDINVSNLGQLKMRDWFKNHSEEKYYHNW
ncbi:hypothetical protein BBO_06070 [Beauveria brongniartii RCEF 3172]|uniref:Uncharacterized protein n=1 Tax=Beauveria brongniartii RCEF 3172 TaxID=1081107 RepID=A0A167BW95_9HYPO|nr:hypothetical protein BBO_06070 [Beauveria brongniartii RCEF 3172]